LAHFDRRWLIGGLTTLFFSAGGFLANLAAARIVFDAACLFGREAGLVFGSAGTSLAQHGAAGFSLGGRKTLCGALLLNRAALLRALALG
jgi:hypothetical protein